MPAQITQSAGISFWIQPKNVEIIGHLREVVALGRIF